MSSNLLSPHSVLTAMIHFVPSPTFECALNSFMINKYIDTSVATVAIKGVLQAYMKRTNAEGKGYRGRDRSPMAEAR